MTTDHDLDRRERAVRKFIKLHHGRSKAQVREKFVAFIEAKAPELTGWRHTNFETEAAFDMFFDCCWDLEIRCN